MRILIIEPSKELAKVLRDALSVYDMKVDIAHNAQAGISRADNNKPDLVILELLIGGHNGLEFIHEFKSYKDWFEVPIIIYSDISSEELGDVIGLAEDMNVIKHFYKPTTKLSEIIQYIKGM